MRSAVRVECHYSEPGAPSDEFYTGTELMLLVLTGAYRVTPAAAGPGGTHRHLRLGAGEALFLPATGHSARSVALAGTRCTKLDIALGPPRDAT